MDLVSGKGVCSNQESQGVRMTLKFSLRQMMGSAAKIMDEGVDVKVITNMVSGHTWAILHQDIGGP